MRPSTSGPSISVASLALICCCAVASVLAATPYVPQSAQELTRNAARLVQEQEYEQALQVLDRAIEEDSEYWEAYYQRGRALAMSGNMEEGLEAFLRSCELNPGFANGHQLASLAAREFGDFETAWDQAIRAYLAGADMSSGFAQLAERSEVPAESTRALQHGRSSWLTSRLMKHWPAPSFPISRIRRASDNCFRRAPRTSARSSCTCATRYRGRRTSASCRSPRSPNTCSASRWTRSARGNHAVWRAI